MKTCPNCKKENNDDAKFCNVCGTPLHNITTPATQPQSPAPKKSKGMLIAIISLVAVVIVLAVVVVLLAGKVNNESSDITTLPQGNIKTEENNKTDKKEETPDTQQATSPEEGVYYINNDSTQYSKIELKNGEAYLYFNLMEGYCTGNANYTVSGNTITLDHVTAYSFEFDGQTTYMDESPDAAIVLNPGASLTINNNVISPQNFEQYWVYGGWGLPYDYFSGSQFYKAQ